METKRKNIDEVIQEMSVLDKARQLTQINAVFLKQESEAEITGMKDSLGVEMEDLKESSSILNFMYGGEMSEIQK